MAKESRGGKRGAEGGGGGGAMLPAVVYEIPIGGGSAGIKYEVEEPSNAESLSIHSYKDSYPTEYAQVMKALKTVEDQYGVTVTDCRISNAMPDGAMAQYTGSGALEINSKYFSAQGMQDAYDYCVKNGWHPSRGNVSGMEACIAHELGHKLNHYAANGEKYGWGSWYDYHDLAGKIVKDAAKSMKMGNKLNAFRRNISGYANSKTSSGAPKYWECVAEAFADVYCNGSNARKESTAVVTELNKYLNH